MFLQKLMSQIGLVFSGMSPTKKVSLIMMTLLSIAVLTTVTLWICSPDYQSLYSGLNSEDAGSIVSYLKENKIQYKITAGGNNIMVPVDKVYELRMELASSGLPQGTGVGFEIFDNSNIGMSEFTQNINYQRALQGEIARTINQFNEIESSRVHIVLPAKTIFRDYEKPSTASVIVKLKGGRKLTKRKVDSIVHLLSSSVSGLEPEHVTVVDNYGNMLTSVKSENDFGSFSRDQMEYQENIEKGFQDRIRSMLETALGHAKAVVRVSCLVNFKKQEKTEEMFYPENRVIRSEERYNEMSTQKDATASGTPSAVTPDQAKDAANNPETGEKYKKEDQTINYEIGKVTSHIIEPIGEIRRLSVAVVVDGTYKENEDEEGNITVEYVARTEEEMAKLKNIVMRAVNFDPKRGDEIEIVNMPFETSKTDAAEEEASAGFGGSSLAKYHAYVTYGAAGFVLLMTFLFVVRPIVSWITSTSLQDKYPAVDPLPRFGGQIEGGVGDAEKQISYQAQASQLLKDDQISIDLLREWMNEA